MVETLGVSPTFTLSLIELVIYILQNFFCQEVAGLGLNGVSINPYFIPGRENACLVVLLGGAAAQNMCDWQAVDKYERVARQYLQTALSRTTSPPICELS